jgi:hypothetical protein
MNKPGQRCTDLISKTASSLSSSVVRLMLLAVQKDNLELNINYAVTWLVQIHNRMRMDMNVVALQGPFCVRKRGREYRDRDKAVHTCISADLGEYQGPIL